MNDSNWRFIGRAEEHVGCVSKQRSKPLSVDLDERWWRLMFSLFGAQHFGYQMHTTKLKHGYLVRYLSCWNIIHMCSRHGDIFFHSFMIHWLIE